MTQTEQLGNFTNQASAYAGARPDYPEAMLDRLIAHVGAAPGDAVADLGAGTGILTQQLVSRGFRVTAVEPNAAMRHEAVKSESVMWLSGSFELTGLDDSSQHWVVAAQAFHWASPEQALPEMRRVLKPGRWLTVMWNDRDDESSTLLAWVQAALARMIPGWDELYRKRDWAPTLTATGDFDDVTAIEMPHVVRMTRQRFCQLWRSHNRLAALSQPGEIDALLAELEAEFDRRKIGPDDAFDVPYICRSWTARAVPKGYESSVWGVPTASGLIGGDDHRLNIGVDIDGTITYAPEFFAAMIRGLRMVGHKIYIVSFRDIQYYHDTQLELGQLDIEYDRLILPDSEVDPPSWKRRIAEEYELDVMFEDSPSNLDAMPPRVKRIWLCDPNYIDLKVLLKVMAQG